MKETRILEKKNLDYAYYTPQYKVVLDFKIPFMMRWEYWANITDRKHLTLDECKHYIDLFIENNYEITHVKEIKYP